MGDEGLKNIHVGGWNVIWLSLVERGQNYDLAFRKRTSLSSFVASYSTVTIYIYIYKSKSIYIYILYFPGVGILWLLSCCRTTSPMRHWKILTWFPEAWWNLWLFSKGLDGQNVSNSALNHVKSPFWHLTIDGLTFYLLYMNLWLMWKKNTFTENSLMINIIMQCLEIKLRKGT